MLGADNFLVTNLFLLQHNFNNMIFFLFTKHVLSDICRLSDNKKDKKIKKKITKNMRNISETLQKALHFDAHNSKIEKISCSKSAY